MTVKELRDRLFELPEDSLVMLKTHEFDYFPNIEVRPFDSTNDVFVIGLKSPYLQIPFNVLESGWRPTAQDSPLRTD